MRSKIPSLLVLVIIVFYGVFKLRVLKVYSDWIKNFGSFDDLIINFNNLARDKDFLPNVLGWLIYYPTYFMLHIIFILLLFKNHGKTKYRIALLLTTVVSFLVIGIYISKINNWDTIYDICYDLFQKLFGLPFILLAIEGGKLIYEDIKKLQAKN